MPDAKTPEKKYFDPLMLMRMVANSVQTERAGLGRGMGQSYVGADGIAKRDLYEALGYPQTLSFNDYLQRFTRQDIADRIVKAPVEGSWQFPPEIVEDEDPKTETKFEKAFDELDKRVDLLGMMERADLLSGIGRLGILVLGYAEDNPENAWMEPVTGKKDLQFVLPLSEQSVKIDTLDDGARFNLPKTYRISPQDASDQANEKAILTPRTIHWSRVIHIAEGLLENEVYGEPRLRSVWNRLEDIERVSGGSAEMYWRGAFPGMSFELDPEAEFDPDARDEQGRSPREAQEDEMDDFIHGVRRYVRLQSIKAQQFSPQVASPKEQLDALIQLVSASKKIPKRILTGSERGELAASQDEDGWIRELDRRRRRYVGFKIVRRTIDRLILHQALPTPANGYQVNWPPLLKTDEKEQAEIGMRVAETIAKYASVPGAESILPLPMFLKIVLKLTDDQIEAAIKANKGLIDREREEIERNRIEGEEDV